MRLLISALLFVTGAYCVSCTSDLSKSDLQASSQADAGDDTPTITIEPRRDAAIPADGSPDSGTPECDLRTGVGCPTTPTCGDGVTDTGEDCDDKSGSADCNANCTFSSCGDGIVNDQAGEACDDERETTTCWANCTLRSCGDGIVDPDIGETCDDAGETASCNANCQLSKCGDTQINFSAGEECDTVAGDAECDADCTTAKCGDGFVNQKAGETCDYSGAESVACDLDCTKVACGDGVVNITAGEACETPESAGCSATCTFEPSAAFVTAGGVAEELEVKMRLGALGLTVSEVLQQNVTLADVAQRGIIVVAASVNRMNFGTKLADSLRPMVLMDDSLLADHSFGPTTASGSTNSVTIAVQHPLNADLTGTVEIWMSPAANNGLVAQPSTLGVVSAATNSSALFSFGYESQAQMVGRRAPARRAGFLPGERPAALTAQGWLLFDAMVRWLMAPPVPIYESCAVLLKKHPMLRTGLYSLRKNDVDSTALCTRWPQP
ncbi:MAG: hypothetical protein RJA70_3254 [Pseudomonadota bacterium]|jgi:hypothetical protein